MPTLFRTALVLLDDFGGKPLFELENTLAFGMVQNRAMMGSSLNKLHFSLSPKTHFYAITPSSG